MAVGDIHAYNAKLDEDINVYAVYDHVKQEPSHVGEHGEDFLKDCFSLEVFHWERVETTTALHQKNSRGVSASMMLKMLEIDPPTGVLLHLSAKKQSLKHNKPKYHTMLSTGATQRAKRLFKARHLGEEGDKSDGTKFKGRGGARTGEQ